MKEKNVKFGLVSLLCCLLTLVACSGGGGGDGDPGTGPGPGPGPGGGGDTTPSYTVTFDSQGGSAVTAQTVNEGAAVTAPADPKKSFRSFGGWYTESACTTIWDFVNNKITADITLYAKWTWNSWQTYNIAPKKSDSSDGYLFNMAWDS